MFFGNVMLTLFCSKIFSIAFVELEASLVGPGPSVTPSGGTAIGPPATPPATINPQKKKKYGLNSSDKLFAQLRDLNFAVVGSLLNKIAKRINENYEVSVH